MSIKLSNMTSMGSMEVRYTQHLGRCDKANDQLNGCVMQHDCQAQQLNMCDINMAISQDAGKLMHMQ